MQTFFNILHTWKFWIVTIVLSFRNFLYNMNWCHYKAFWKPAPSIIGPNRWCNILVTKLDYKLLIRLETIWKYIFTISLTVFPMQSKGLCCYHLLNYLFIRSNNHLRDTSVNLIIKQFLYLYLLFCPYCSC